jgi:hypothetical protein
MELDKEKAHLDGEYTEDKVEEEAQCLQDRMSIILNALAENIRICTKSGTLWNANIKGRRKAVRREKSRR